MTRVGLKGLKERGQRWVRWWQDKADDARERWPVLARLVRTLQHYGDVVGTQLAGGVTYYGFLSFFPIVALSFAAVGFIIEYVPDADNVVIDAISTVLPGIVGAEPGQIDVQEDIADRRTGVGIVGLVALLYTGLGWMSAVRRSLGAVFSPAAEEKRNFIVGKLVDLGVLVVLGVILLVTVTLSTAVGAFTRTVIGWVGLADVSGITWVLRLAVIAVGIVANTVLFFTMFRLLPKHHVPAKELVQGALLAGVGLEVLKQLANIVIGLVTGNALYGAFAIMIALLVWINYFARLTVLGACWAAVPSMAGVQVPEEEAEEDTEAEDMLSADVGRPRLGHGARVGIGVASAIGVALVVLSRVRRRPGSGPLGPGLRGSVRPPSPRRALLGRARRGVRGLGRRG